MAQYDGSIRIGTGIDTKGFDKDEKELESKVKKLGKSFSNSAEIEVKVDASGAEKEFEKVVDDIEKEEKRIEELAKRAVERARAQQETAITPQVAEESRSFTPGYNQDAIKHLEEYSAKADEASKHFNFLKQNVEELSKNLLELQKEGKFFGDTDYDKIYVAWKNATDAIKDYRKELEKDTESGMAKAAEQEAKSAEKQAAAEAKIAAKEAERQAKEEARIAAIQAKEEAKRAKEVAAIQAQEAEERRLAQIRENAVVGNQRIIQTVERIKQLEQEIADLKAAGITEGYQDYNSRVQELEQLRQEVKDYNNGIEEVKKSYSLLGKIAQKVLLSIGSRIKKSAISSFKLLGKEIKNVASSMLGFGKSAKSSNNILNGGIKNILKYGLGIRSLYALVNKLRTSIKEGFSNMANDVESFWIKVDSLKASTLTLKNSLAAAFRPLVEIAMPYIQMVADAMANLLDTVGQFMAAIAGQKSYTKAIKQTTAALEDENKAQNKQLSGLDKLNNLSSGSGGGAGGGASGQMFEENVPISSAIMDSFQNLKDLVESEDWKGIGEYVANALNSGLQKVYDFLNWDNIGPKITYFVTAFTEAFNRLVDGFEWDTLGRTIGAGINTVVNTLNLLIDGIEWENLGAKISTGFRGMLDEVEWTNLGNLIGNKFMILWDILAGFVDDMWKSNDLTGLTGWSELGIALADALNGVFSKIKLSEIGATLGRALTGIFQSAIDFSATFDWEGLGTNIYEGINSFFSNTDWATVGKGISDFVMGILDTILTAIEGIDWFEVGKSIVDFILNIDWIGLVQKLNDIGVQLILGVLKGILGIMAGIGDWLTENVFRPFIDWFKKLFGIHSPSTVMAELGKFIMEGLLNGIKSLVDTVVGAIQNVWDGIKKVFDGFMTFLTGTFTGDWGKAWDGIVSIFESVKGVIDNIVGGIVNIIKGVIDTIHNAIQAIKDFFSESSKMGSVSGAAGGAISSIKGKSANSSFANSVYATQGIAAGLMSAEIPKLATGAVIPANREFLAVLGDQKHGTNIEAPLDTIVDAVKIALQDIGFGNANQGGKIELNVTANVEGQTLFKITQDYALDFFNRTGMSAYPI